MILRGECAITAEYAHALKTDLRISAAVFIG
jgi:antitoxin component HigA of HigAB toxin-antitoxin module